MKQFTRRVGQVFAHCSAIRSPSFVVISTLSFPAFPFKRICSCIPTLPSRKFARTKEHHSWEGRKARNELSGEGVELLSSSSRREAIYLSRRIGIHVIARLFAIRLSSRSQRSLSLPSRLKELHFFPFPTFPFKRICSCIPTLPSRKFARTKEHHSWEGRKARNELSGEGVELPSSSSRREAIYLSRRIGIHVIARLFAIRLSSRSQRSLSLPSRLKELHFFPFPTFPFKRICSCIPTLPLRKFARTKEHHSWEGRKARGASFQGRELISGRIRRVWQAFTHRGYPTRWLRLASFDSVPPT